MARMRGARWVGPHHDNGDMSRYDIVCIHTIGGGYAPAHAAHFSTDAGGGIFQSRDTEFASAANLNGNPRVIAIENEDRGPRFGNWNTRDGHAVPAFTAEQIEAIARICAWAHTTHGIPLVACPDSRPRSRGIAYHRQGIDGNWAGYAYSGRVSGGEVWTAHRGKVCPGDRRIRQIPRIIARAREIVGGEEWWMSEIPASEVAKIAKAVRDLPADPKDPDSKTLGQFVRSGAGAAIDTKYQTNTVEETLARLTAVMETLAAEVADMKAKLQPDQETS